MGLIGFKGFIGFGAQRQPCAPLPDHLRGGRRAVVVLRAALHGLGTRIRALGDSGLGGGGEGWVGGGAGRGGLWFQVGGQGAGGSTFVRFRCNAFVA